MPPTRERWVGVTALAATRKIAFSTLGDVLRTLNDSLRTLNDRPRTLKDSLRQSANSQRHFENTYQESDGLTCFTEVLAFNCLNPIYY